MKASRSVEEESICFCARFSSLRQTSSMVRPDGAHSKQHYDHRQSRQDCLSRIGAFGASRSPETSLEYCSDLPR